MLSAFRFSRSVGLQKNFATKFHPSTTGAISKVLVRGYAQIPLETSVTLPTGEEYVQPTGLFINGEFVPSRQKKTFEVFSPATEELIATIYESREDDVDIAIQAAQNAFDHSPWATSDPSFRALAFFKLADLIEQHAETLASIESLDNGKSLGDARGDVALGIACLRSAAGWADKFGGKQIETGDDYFNFTRREPIGVVGQIIPWNFPLLMLIWKITGIVVGNTSVLKTAESTPLSALYLCNLIKENDVFPPGVFNVVSGFGKITGNALVEHPLVRKIAFTGSTATGKALMKKAADTMKKITLELGGKSPNIIFNDADLDVALKSVVAGIYYNSGEVCSAGSRLYVHEDIYDVFIKKLVDFANSSVKVGNPFLPDTIQGAQNSVSQLDKILKYIQIGTEEGATVLAGGKRLEEKGYFVQPTIFGDVKPDSKINKEEIFGPVVTVSKFKTVDEVVKLANDTEYGLAAGIQSNDFNKVIDVSRRLKAGTVWVNTYNDYHPMVPFGGFKQSGIGRELGEEVLHNYTEIKSVRAAVTRQN
ncbi:aldehyde dehydrogenase [Hyphopichia burtonii NRRL Y-1933]|uniref:Aldehyde dehydrogenase n=1 Tax=Hyphopichia burtonii NRRL Y-1933 TaxID=984485 RepID=A0A1E4RDS8_9ASCO|nr:aldehyde dehydrogenase [Hyphopichia burtonii NRRL Y-1933]ODV65412.1 aldehyde dehydrogenase [Hyphopichia burtonii NRRL Y-1933]